ncbi:MAG: glutamate racemase, partial [Alistipes sp.]|nr:glutamate racemase [Alistipes sp.]
IYDSGMGGLSVRREVYRLLPEESVIYLGDGKNCPYGSRSVEEIRRLSVEAVEHLLAMGCKLIVVACNTATAAAIELLRARYPEVPIVGMEPAVKPACLQTKSRVVGVLATERSLDGDLFRRTAARYGQDIEVVTAPGCGFVELVECDKEQSEEAVETVRRAMQPMLDRGADHIVLGCTHYPFLLEALKRAAEGYRVTFVDPSPAVARRVKQLLEVNDLLCEAGHSPQYEFVTFADEAYRDRLEQKAADTMEPISRVI